MESGESDMIKIISVIFIMMLTAAPAKAFDSWSKQDIALQTVYMAMHISDWNGTLRVAKHPNKYYEMNPIMGRYPSESTVNTYMASSLVISTLAIHVMPSKYRPYAQCLAIGLKGSLLAINAGVHLRF